VQPGPDFTTLEHPPVVTTGMLIRKPAAEVFAAFVDPEATTRFWFTRSSGRLEPRRTVRWWEMYGAATTATVLEFDPGQRILIEGAEPANRVEWVFTTRPDGTTLVGITHVGFSGTGEEVVAQALDSMGGFAFVLAALKALLEHGVELILVADRAPYAHVPANGRLTAD
jgi:uncharacterized protein YndB with AHSA1/START domain